MKVLGISPLDKDATASLVEDGKVLFAAGEERYSRIKQHAGFPGKAIEAALNFTGIDPDEIDAVAYPFFEWDRETELMKEGFAKDRKFGDQFGPERLANLLSRAEQAIHNRSTPVHGLRHPNQVMKKSFLKKAFYRLAGTTPYLSNRAAQIGSREWLRQASADHRRYQSELEAGLSSFGLRNKLQRFEHHLSHVANSYLASGFEKSLIVTLDGYGSGLAGSISLGDRGKMKRLKNFAFPHSWGTYYESVTSSLGFNPDRHAGKIVGLAAYGDPSILADTLLSRIDLGNGDYQIFQSLNIFFSRYLSTRFPMVDMAAAWQHILEVAVTNVVHHWALETGCSNVVLSGGVAANVKLNQRIHELRGIKHVFVYPNMGDGGCGTGLGLLLTSPEGVAEPLEHVYFGPGYSNAEISSELDRAGLDYEEPNDLASTVATQIAGGKVVARFDGRMEYGPRALGNRSILYHAEEPDVNQWLNQRLGRTEFMPFAPVTLWEHRDQCYKNLEGAERPAQFMTITFDCTDFMIEKCPAAVHVDGTARPQLIKRETNPGYYDIVKSYERITGIPSLINTSFNMHEEPIVCTPVDAIRSFLDGRLDALAIGPYYVASPKS